MDIKSVLDERIICTELDAVDKEDALKKMIKMLLDAGYIDDAEGFYEDVLLRESQGITGIGNYIAIPHGKSSSVSKVGISIAKLNNEIQWETNDGKGVKVIFLFAVGDDSENSLEHLKLLAQVAGRIASDEAVAACTVGIAHTYIAREKLMEAAKKRGHEIHMETQGVIGIEDELDPKDIAEADVVILAVDVNVKHKERFAGKKMIEVPTETVVMSPNKLIEKIEQLV